MLVWVMGEWENVGMLVFVGLWGGGCVEPRYRT